MNISSEPLRKVLYLPKDDVFFYSHYSLVRTCSYGYACTYSIYVSIPRILYVTTYAELSSGFRETGLPSLYTYDDIYICIKYYMKEINVYNGLRPAYCFCSRCTVFVVVDDATPSAEVRRCSPRSARRPQAVRTRSAISSLRP